MKNYLISILNFFRKPASHMDDPVTVNGKENSENKWQANSYLHFFKCQNQICRLEFVVLSWHEDWPNKHKAYCPECNKQESALLRSVASERPICDIVYNLFKENNGKTE